MKLDDVAKGAAIFSAVVTALLAIAGFVGNSRLQKLQTTLSQLSTSEKTMDVDKKRYDYSARLTVDFSLPLARSFALQAAEAKGGDRRIAMPTEALGREFMASTDAWEARRGLMTGSACQSEGLKARQVVTLIVSNIGNIDATDVSLTLRQKHSPFPDPRTAWSERDAGGAAIGYDGLAQPSARWETVEVPIGTLRGLASPEAARTSLQVVLASVSGTTSLFGTVLVPVRISWTDSVGKRRQSLPVYAEHTGELRANLLGAEIGSLGSTCRQTQGAR